MENFRLRTQKTDYKVCLNVALRTNMVSVYLMSVADAGHGNEGKTDLHPNEHPPSMCDNGIVQHLFLCCQSFSSLILSSDR